MKLTEAREYLSRFYVKARQSARRQSRSSASTTTAVALDISSSPTCRQSTSITSVKPPAGSSDKVPSTTRKRASRLSLKSSKRKLKQTRPPPNIEPTKVNSHDSTLTPRADSSSDADAGFLDNPVSPDSSAVYLPDPPIPMNRGTDQLVATRAGDLPRLSGDTLDDGIASRKASSSHTVFSEKSNGTVHRDPSKRSTTPIETIDTVIQESNPFSDTQTLRRILSSSRSVLVPRGSSQEIIRCPDGLADCSLPMPHTSSHHCICTRRSSGSENPQMTSRKASNSSDDTSSRILAGNEAERREFMRSRAIDCFNKSADHFRLDTITPLQRRFIPVPDQTADRTASLLGRLRRVKSTLNLKRKDDPKSLRRIKTYADVNAQCPLGSLKGKTVEDLARLGGESMLNLPPEYGPGALRLPTCIAAPAYYLLQHGTSVPHAHGLSRNATAVAALYSHYASQILAAESVKDTINQTTRSMDLPSQNVYIGDRNKSDLSVQDVSTVFRHFLCELPGGILGSGYLYRTLAGIYEHDFSSNGKRNGDPGSKEYISGLQPSLAAKVRMTTLALLALTTDMQFELICAVFGLLSLTSDECSDRKKAHKYLHDPDSGPCQVCLTYPSLRSLGRVFGCLLYEPKGVRNPELMVQFLMTEYTLVADVTTMLIDLWKNISSQLRMWGVIEAGR